MRGSFHLKIVLYGAISEISSKLTLGVVVKDEGPDYCTVSSIEIRRLSIRRLDAKN